MDALCAFLRESCGRRFAWGERDCALWVCDWVVRARGVDPGAAFRGAYRTARGCRRLLRREGGLLALATRCCAAAGLVEIAPHHAGHGAVVCVAAPWGDTLGIMLASRRVAMLARGGGLIGSAVHPIARAWQ